MSQQPFGEYRGCTIFIHPGDEPKYSNSCTVGLRFSISRVKDDIDDYRDKVPEPPEDEEPEPEPEPDPYQPIGAYRGCTLLIWSAYDPVHYSSSCTITHRYSIAKVKEDIDDYREKIPEPPPEEPTDHVVETYREVDIWWKVDLDAYWAQVAVGYVAVWPTLGEMYTSIDEILEELEPDEDPAEGLLAQIYAGILTWIDDNLGDYLQPVFDWVDGLFEDATDAWESLVSDAVTLIDDVSGALTTLATEVGDRWDTFTDETLPDIWDTITTKVGEVSDALTTARSDLAWFMITGLAHHRTWTRDLFKLLIPMGFLQDPVGYLKAAFNIFIDPWAEGMIKAFLEGFEEGLEE